MHVPAVGLHAKPVTAPKWKTLGCTDIGACESIMKKKTKQDFQEMIKVEHGEGHSLCLLLPPHPSSGSSTFALMPASLPQVWAASQAGCPLQAFHVWVGCEVPAGLT